MNTADLLLLRKISANLAKFETLRAESEKTLTSKQVELHESQLKHSEKQNLSVADQQASEVIKALFDKVSEKGFKFLEQLGTQALQIVFPDESYTFKIVMGSRGAERTVEFFVNDGTNEVPLSETGGGVQVLLSFVFRIYFILRNDLRKVVVMDEAFAQLSPQYLDCLLQFLQMLVDKFGFTFLWISHSPYLEGRVTKFYEMSKGELVQR